ncbi:hypothetical protein B0H15DRAFT_816456 [Mycena belliarum]|uniref:F-box domain-containing protein n=1 Tax=Mycena belliarum TaxID=1033014 RepID=A0AAD6UKC4_9AGAR|nr:hypothetical protein B0H15DRAFT_816456 [Mycena belliae]
MKNQLVQVVDRARQGFKRSRSGSVCASQLASVPPELWDKIFSYLCAPWDIRAVSLTCHCFRQLAQPLLFSKISTHPAPPTLGLRGLQMNKYRRRTLQRLDFFLSPHIAPAVRECWIDPPSAEDEELPTDVLIDAIFDGLRKLPNLRVLGCRSIRLTPKRLAVLQRLALTAIALESCLSDLVDFANLPALPLSYVTLKYSDVHSDAILPPLLSLFLSPRHLQRLCATSTEILPVITRSRPFMRLHHLELPPEALVSPLFPSALAACPALERITCHTAPETALPHAAMLPALPSGLLPALRAYRGPRAFAAFFARASTAPLQTLELSAPYKAPRVLRTLAQVPRVPALEYLSFRVDGVVPPALLASVHALCPALRTLSVNEPALSTSEILALLGGASPSPPASPGGAGADSPRTHPLRVLRVRVEGRDRYNLWIPPLEEAADAVACFRKIEAALARTYPGLATLKLMYGVDGACVVWRRSAATGLLVQVTVL